MKFRNFKKVIVVSLAVITLMAVWVWTSTAQLVQPTKPAPSPNTANLSQMHKDKGINCAGCHGSSMVVDDNETVANAKCVSCHGALSDLGKKSKEAINAHKSHLGKISCTTCHHGHVASRAYCLNCHTFAMPIPGGNAVPKSKKAEARTDSRKDTADIVIIGAGASGFTAAITAHDAGAKVILLEKQSITGGNSMLAAGGMNAAHTKAQLKKNIQDSTERMFADTMKGGQNVNNPELVKVLADKSAESYDWLTSIGANISDVGMLGGASVKRAHRPVGGGAVGAHVIQVLRKNAADRKIDIRVNSKVLEVLRDKDGRAVGVQVDGKHRGLYIINAKAVIIASGGFSANAAMVESYRPSYKGMTTSNQPGATGEGMLFGEAAGGALVDMKEIQIHPTVAAGSRILITEAVRGNGAILINKEGKRFVNEMTTRDAASAAILKQPGQMAYLILDDNIRKSLKQIEGYFHLDLVKVGVTLNELAAAIGVPADALEATVAAYNTAVDTKNDVQFKRPDMPRSIKTPKFLAIAVQPGIHYTMGGLKIDSQARVIGKDGKPVPGLFAAGEVTGGVHGANRLGGNSISETITFGRIAGANATQLAVKK